MIDSHCHLEDRAFDSDREELIGKLRKELRGVITVATHPNDLQRVLELSKRYRGFVFACAAIHPEYIKEISEIQISDFISKIQESKDDIVAIGECGLDYFWVKEEEYREQQKKLFARFIKLANELKKPLVVHTRDAHEDVLNILEENEAKRVVLHMWGGENFTEKVNSLNYSITVGPIITTSKNHKKIVRDTPIEKILLETDSPYFGHKKSDGTRERGTPLNIRIPAEKIAEIKNLSPNEVLEACGGNAMRFFKLNL